MRAELDAARAERDTAEHRARRIASTLTERDAAIRRLQKRADAQAAALNALRASPSYRVMSALWRAKSAITAPVERVRALLSRGGGGQAPARQQLTAPRARRDVELSQLRVAAILDEMSMACFAPECELMPVRRDDWQQALEQKPPDMLLVESAWSGNGGAWQYGVASYDHPDHRGLPALRALVDWCRANDVPTVFWNKEDPVHFDRFREAAALFDHVFTTDANRVPDYEALPDSRIRSVAALGFAAQPRIHNPSGAPAERSDAPCFAGTYYRDRHVGRQGTLEMLLDAARPFGLVIYDRTHGTTDPAFGFPERFAEHIVGSVPYEQMLDVYRSHKLFLNVNSVADSPTMFSRRVFELLACGTAVVSTPSDGIAEIFGDLVPIVETPEEATAAIDRILHDDEHRRDLTERARALVLSKHTYEHRLATIARAAGYEVRGAKGRTVAVYGEIDLNLIDGSSIWLQSLGLTLASMDDVSVTVLSRTPPERDVVTAALREHGVEVVAPGDLGYDVRRLDADQAAEALERLDSERQFDLVVLRGDAVSDAIVRRGAFDGRIWLYHLPPRPGERAEEDVDGLGRRVAAAHRVLCQTDDVAQHVIDLVPGAKDKVIALPPMIPAPAGKSGTRTDLPMRLLYAGKVAPEYCFLEMVELFRELRRRYSDLEFHVAGDKVHDPPEDPGFRPAAEAALHETDGLVWHGGVSRRRVSELTAEAALALSIRTPQMNESREISTKVLEYGAAGCPVVLNRASAYERLLGSDYPLFVEDADHALPVLERALADADLRRAAADACERASAPYAFDRVAAALQRELPAPPAASNGRATNGRVARSIVVAGHDLKFMSPLPEHLVERGASVREDVWTSHREHDQRVSRELLAWSDAAFCEWCLGNAVWYSQNAREEQRVVIRVHRMELDTEFPSQVDLDRVSAVVFVAHHILDEAVLRFDWPREKLHVIENVVDYARFRRPKADNARFTLALVGWVPERKRLDRALDILRAVRAEDSRFRLLLKGKRPEDIEWVWRDEGERRYFEKQLGRIETDPLLRGAVEFDHFGPDLPDFLSQVGFVLSTSDHEGHQIAPAEGMASGAVPVFIDRDGARRQYDESWVHDDPGAAAGAVLEAVGSDRFAEESARAAEFARRWSHDAVLPQWDAVLGLGPDLHQQ